MKKRFPATILLLALLLTACSKVPVRQVSQGAGDAAPAGEMATITVAGLGTDPFLDALISAFHAKYTNYRVDRVTITPAGGNPSEQVAGKAKAGEVDVVPTRYLQAGDLNTGVLAPLDPFIQKTGFDLKPIGAGLDQLKIEGKLLDLPYAAYPQTLLYDRAMFQQAGVPLPKEGWTWEQFRDAAKKLTKGEGENKVWGFSSFMNEGLVAMYLAQKTGGPAALADEKDVQDALRLFATMVHTDQSVPKSAPQEVGKGTTIMVRNGPGGTRSAMSAENIGKIALGLVQVGKGNGPKWDVAPMPVAPGAKMVGGASPDSFGIAAGSKNQEAAWKFVSFAAGPEGAAAIAKAGGTPLYKTEDVKKAFLAASTYNSGAESLWNTNWTFEPRQQSNPKYGPLAQALNLAANQALAGTKSWEDAYAEYLQVVKAIKAQ